ncbi:MAG: hypothetical protein ACJAYC_002392 [Halieaceae bacterium]|jgi:hypothetical protein
MKILQYAKERAPELNGNHMAEQAEKIWLDLQERCKNCALPETLEQSIILYLQDVEH